MSEAQHSRRALLAAAGALAGAATITPTAEAQAQTARRPRNPHPRTPTAALAVLKRGNRRYQRGELTLRDYSPVGEDRANQQRPFAAIITCADSRISPTLVFDLERGNIFVSRVAGNSIDVGTLGSTEYAVAVLGAS